MFVIVGTMTDAHSLRSHVGMGSESDCLLGHQYAFRPTGSTTAALISLLHTVTQMLITNSYAIVIAMDFSKVFDTVRHVTLLEKMANLDLPDHVLIGWLIFSVSDNSAQHIKILHQCCQQSQPVSIQGSAVGPASCVVSVSDLKEVTAGNVLCKYADDTYAIERVRSAAGMGGPAAGALLGMAPGSTGAPDTAVVSPRVYVGTRPKRVATTD